MKRRIAIYVALIATYAPLLVGGCHDIQPSMADAAKVPVAEVLLLTGLAWSAIFGFWLMNRAAKVHMDQMDSDNERLEKFLRGDSSHEPEGVRPHGMEE